MGPRLFRRGNFLRSAGRFRRSAASMGPRLFRRGNKNAPPKAGLWRHMLQWGHVFSDVEIGRFSKRSISRTGLQWGHVFSDVEITHRAATFCWSNGLQWGHVFSDVEMAAIICLTRRGPISLQWGHVFSDVEIRTLPIEMTIITRASMGPRLFRRGNAEKTNIRCAFK